MEDGGAPATRRDLEELRNHLSEQIRDTETKLLNAFYTFAESNQKRIAAVESEDAAIKSRLATLENRLLEVEKRLNMPPAS